MVLWDIVTALSPYERVVTAVGPFVCAMLLRLFMGRTSLTRHAISGSTLWFLVNVLIAPYSEGMGADLREIAIRLFR